MGGSDYHTLCHPLIALRPGQIAVEASNRGRICAPSMFRYCSNPTPTTSVTPHVQPLLPDEEPGCDAACL